MDLLVDSNYEPAGQLVAMAKERRKELAQARMPLTLKQKQDLRQKLLSEVEAHTDGDELLLDSLRLHVATTNPELLTLRHDVMHAFKCRYKALTGRSMLKAELEGYFPVSKPAKGGKTLAQLPLTEFGVTERLRAAHGKQLLFSIDSADRGAWFRYASGHWQQEPSDVRVVQLAREVVKTLRPQAEAIVDPELAEEALKAVAVCERTGFAQGVVNGLAGEPGILTSAQEFDVRPELLCVRNGIVDLRTGELLPADPLARLTMVTACDYNPEAKAPWFDRTVRDSFRGNTEVIAFFQRLMGYSIRGRPKERVLVVPFGKGKNGKSTLFNSIQETLGSHAATMNSTTIAAPVHAQAAGDGSGPTEHMLRLRGKRAIFATEIKRGAVFNDDTVKTLASGGDRILARGLFSRNSVEFEPTGVVFSPSNVLAQVRDDDQAVWDRLVLLHFGVRFGEVGNPELDNDRPAKLKAEQEGILAWLVRGALEYQRIGLAIPESLHRLKQEQREGSSPIGLFLEDCCELGKEFAESTQALFAAWQASAAAQGERHIAQSEVAFGRYIAAHAGVEKCKVTVKGQQVRGYRGIRLRKGNVAHLPADIDQDSLEL